MLFAHFDVAGERVVVAVNIIITVTLQQSMCVLEHNIIYFFCCRDFRDSRVEYECSAQYVHITRD